MFYCIKRCRACGEPSHGVYCQPCIDEDTRMIDDWERSYVRRCEPEDSDEPRDHSATLLFTDQDSDNQPNI